MKDIRTILEQSPDATVTHVNLRRIASRSSGSPRIATRAGAAQEPVDALMERDAEPAHIADAGAAADAAGAADAADAGGAADASDAVGAEEAADAADAGDPAAQTVPERAAIDDRSLLIVPALLGGALAAWTSGHHGVPDSPDVVPPIRPGVPSLALRGGSGSDGSLASARATVVVGDVAPGAAWEYRVGDGAWSTGSGHELPVTTLGGDGPIALQVRAVQGGVASDVAGLSFTLDTQVEAPRLRLHNDTGIAGDRTTQDATVDIDGLEDGAHWAYSLDGGTEWRPGNADGRIAASEFTADGDFTVLVRQTDVAGNVSPAQSLSFTRDTTTNAPTLALAVDSGVVDTDGLTNDGRVTVAGLEPGATFEYRVGGGGWQAGSGAAIDPTAFAEGANGVEVRQIDAQGNIGPASALAFTLKTQTDILDLDDAAGVQQDHSTMANGTRLSSGVPLVQVAGSLTAADLVQELRLQLGGDGLDVDHDVLRFDREIALNADAAGTNVSIGGVDGMSYRYDSASRSLTLWRTDGDALTGAMAARSAGAIRLQNDEGRPRNGDRIVDLSYLDQAGNRSLSSHVTIDVDTRPPRLDLNGARPGIHIDEAIRQLEPGLPLLAADRTVDHEDPAALMRGVRIDLVGAGASRDDRLLSVSGGSVTPLTEQVVRFIVDDTTWRMTRRGGAFSFVPDELPAASQAQTQAMLRSLRFDNLQPDPLQGDRTFHVLIVDEHMNGSNARAQFVVDSVAPVVDLNGKAPGSDHAVAVTPGIPWAFALAQPATGGVRESDKVTGLTLRFASPVNGAFDLSSPDRAEWVGFFNEADGGDRSGMLRLGQVGTLSSSAVVAGKTLTLTMSGGSEPELTVAADTPMKEQEAAALLRALNYSAEVNAGPGVRTVGVSATDRAGNTSTVVTTTLDVSAVDTPVILLSHESDTGMHGNDSITQRNGSPESPLVFHGFAAAGAAVTLLRDIDKDGALDPGETIGTAVADAQGHWTCTVDTAAIPDGKHPFRAVAGAWMSAPTLVTIDTSPPASSFALESAVMPRPRLAGTTDPDVPVTIELDTDQDPGNGDEIRYVTRTDATGRWMLDMATADPVAGGRHDFSQGDVVGVRVTGTDWAGNTTVRTGSASVTATQFDISNANVIEGRTDTRELVFMVSRSGDLSAPGSVVYTVDPTASSAKNVAAGLPGLADQDYTGADSGVVAFAAGESSKFVTFTVRGDYYREVNDKLVVKLSSPTSGTIGDGVAIGNIQEVDLDRLQAAYGLRDLNPSRNDYAIRVRRSSDNAEMDLGFDDNGKLDRQALLDFVGTDASSTGYVTRWYDQSGHDRDMVQDNPGKQGVIVDGGAVLTRADGSVAFSMNNGRNGANDDHYIADGVAASDWRSVVIYAEVQSEGSRNGSLFNLGEAGPGRLSASYPQSTQNRGYIFDVNEYGQGTTGRLLRPLTSSLTGLSNDVVVEAHSGNTSAGMPDLNFTDATQVIYENGVRVASDADLPATFSTTADWKLAWHGAYANGDSNYYQQAMFSEFMVYLAKDNSTPELQALLGSGGQDVLTYAGEPAVMRIDGLAGTDTLYLSGATSLDFSAFPGGVRGIEQVWMDNGAANTVTLTTAMAAENGASTLTLRMDAGDAVVLNGERLAYSASERQTLIIGSAGRDVVVGSSRNDQMMGGGDADTFTWLPQQGGKDTVLDFSSVQDDRLDLSRLLRGFTPGDEDAYLRKVVGDNDEVSLLIDWDGRADFATPDLTIDLRYVLSTDPIQVVVAPGTSLIL